MRVKRLHQEDLAKGGGAVYLPDALERKFPNASREWIWQLRVFPSDKLSVDPRSGETRRHHLDESGLQKAVRAAAAPPASTSASLATPSGTPSPRTCWKTITISARSRNSWATRTSARR